MLVCAHAPCVILLTVVRCFLLCPVLQASLAGVYLGRIRWFDSKRTLEGTLAAIGSIMSFTWILVATMGWINEVLFDGLLTIIPPVSASRCCCGYACHALSLS